jgi:hypothetical protein
VLAAVGRAALVSADGMVEQAELTARPRQVNKQVAVRMISFQQRMAFKYFSPLNPERILLTRKRKPWSRDDASIPSSFLMFLCVFVFM